MAVCVNGPRGEWMKPAIFYDQDYFDSETSGKGYGSHGIRYVKRVAPFRELALVLRGYCKPERVIDFGCAKGFMVQTFHELGVKARGFDFSSYAISAADPSLEPYLQIRDLCEDKEFPPCDLGICMDVLEHIDTEKLPEVIARIQRSCEKYLFTICGLSTNPDDLLHEDHVSLFPIETWQELLTQGDFEVDPRNDRLIVSLFDAGCNQQLAMDNWGFKATLLRRKV